jgi:hypothetical protein
VARQVRRIEFLAIVKQSLLTPVLFERRSSFCGWRQEGWHIPRKKISPLAGVATPSHKECGLKPDQRSFCLGHLRPSFHRIVGLVDPNCVIPASLSQTGTNHDNVAMDDKTVRQAMLAALQEQLEAIYCANKLYWNCKEHNREAWKIK